jgi:tetratricopeptide (TPR) repeat protein
MDAFWQFWNNLTQGLRDNIVGGLISALAVIGVVGVFKMMGFSLRTGVRSIAKLVLRGEHKADPTSTPTPHTLIVKLEPSQSPPLLAASTKVVDAATPSPVSLIPRPPAVGFVARRDTEGRDILACLKEELAPEKKQLMALCGAGGLGKTTLAAESVRALSEDSAKRIAWVSADGRPDFTLSTLLDGVAEQLGHPELRPLTFEQKDEQLCAIIAASPALIVLDNFETVNDTEQERCADWLANRANCSAVITSRNEVPYARPVNIFAMSMPEAQELVGRLIAQARHPQSFNGLERDEIISAADRNPLVLQWIIKQIDQAKQPRTVLSELSQGKGDAARRVFGRSFNLLNNDGRATLLALSLFVPSASRQALAEVAGFGEDAARLDAAAAQLAELWLASPTEANERLTVEGLTRELAKNLLAKDARAAEFRQRFVAHFLRYAESHAKTTPEDFAALEAEKDNILSAMDVAFSLDDWVTVMRLMYAMNLDGVNGLLMMHGYWDEAIRRGEQARKAAHNLHDERAISGFAHCMALILQERGQIEEARRLYEESLEISKKLGDESGIAGTTSQLGIVLYDEGKLAESKAKHQESLAIRRKLGEQRGISIDLHQLAMLAHKQGELEEAQQLYNESLAIAERLGDQSGIASTLHQLARLAQGQGELKEARRLYDKSLEIKRRLGDQSGIAIALGQLGLLASQEGDRAEAVRLTRMALSIFEKLKSPYAEIAREALKRWGNESS